ncbi:MAG: DUF697 domain-containing protein [Methylococcales bacterium]|nr:DUF697 domain-containing protein [Methylococcales bacterium]
MATTAKKSTTEKKESTESVESKETVQNPVDNRVDRLTKAHDSIKNYTMAAVTVGLIPVPFIDIAALSTIQLKMLHSISKKYDIPFSKNIVKSLISSLIGSSAAVTVALPLASLLKVVPIIGQTSGVLSTSVISAASTYAIGKVFVAHFESGGTFLNFDTEKAKAHFNELYAEGKDFISSNKKEEVKA